MTRVPYLLGTHSKGPGTGFGVLLKALNTNKNLVGACCRVGMVFLGYAVLGN